MRRAAIITLVVSVRPALRRPARPPPRADDNNNERGAAVSGWPRSAADRREREEEEQQGHASDKLANAVVRPSTPLALPHQQGAGGRQECVIFLEPGDAEQLLGRWSRPRRCSRTPRQSAG